MEYRTDLKFEFGARKIQAYWRCYQDRRLFKLLLETVRAAENCLAPAILRLLSPVEASLLTDPSMRCKVRFRFSGSKFPPVIVFKIFYLGGGGQNISRRKGFQPNNLRTADTCRMMGSRIFLNHILADDIRKQSRSILHASDVTCTRDFVQYTSHVDELPAYLGGRENTWRSLSLKELPQRDAVANGHQQKRLSPPCRDGRQHLRLQRSPVTPPCSVVSTERSDLNPTPLLPTGPSTRKCNTAHRVRQLHLLRNKLREADNGDRQRGGGCQEKACIGGLKESVSTRLAVPLVEEKGFNDVAFSEWEEEADKLYIWTQQLDISDIDTAPYPEK